MHLADNGMGALGNKSLSVIKKEIRHDLWWKHNLGTILDLLTRVLALKASTCPDISFLISETINVDLAGP